MAALIGRGLGASVARSDARDVKTQRHAERQIIAWIVDGGDEWCELIYAKTRGQARAKAAGIDGEDFLHVNARRAPEWDAFAPNGPGDERLFEAGWWFNCCRCDAYARQCEGAICVKGRFYCTDHLPPNRASPAAGTDWTRDEPKSEPDQ